MPFTRGFAYHSRLIKHFGDHGNEVGAATVDEYLSQADSFLGGPLRPTMREDIRPRDGALIRFDVQTEEFGILNSDGYISTYFVPDPRWHGFPTNYSYFRNECQKKV